MGANRMTWYHELMNLIMKYTIIMQLPQDHQAYGFILCHGIY